MKTYYMKIRDKYIKEVRDGVKKHEYRLASPDRKAVRVGDNIILISNTDKKSYVRTTVKRITTYRDWKEALEKNWQNDFKNLYSTLEEALRECYRFYPKDEVDKNGIISFDIEPCYPLRKTADFAVNNFLTSRNCNSYKRIFTKQSENVGAYSAEKKAVRKNTFPPPSLKRKR